MTDVNATGPMKVQPAATPYDPTEMIAAVVNPEPGPLPVEGAKDDILVAPPGIIGGLDAGNLDGAVHHLGPGAALEAMNAAMGRYGELGSDTLGAGSTIGDVLTLPDVPSDFAKNTAGTDAGVD